jgi:hypothetical protein
LKRGEGTRLVAARFLMWTTRRASRSTTQMRIGMTTPR